VLLPCCSPYGLSTVFPLKTHKEAFASVGRGEAA